ncbi:MAG: preprotein translocase subunit SecE [Planctomycetota bacterium]|nr:preprotein translocase subunit SecE [Planctomycetota bacterium]MCX8040208.1 preprotein translocase subunit SecE [Planctomycetota bacterium]MDW8372497.1 preprotein translocase subunit SecE [Planctomycetota bacterium]
MFYLWPQGRIVRIAVVVLAALIAVDLGYSGSYAAWRAYAEGDAGGVRQLVLAVLYGVLALTALIVGIVAAGPHRRAVQFLIEVQEEMQRVTWPTGSELWRSTLVVAVAIACLAGLVFLTDLALYHLLQSIRA